MVKERKKSRILELYIRFCEGDLINKTEESKRYHVDERSIQRDIDDIRCFLNDRRLHNASTRKIIYDRNRKGFVMIEENRLPVVSEEILEVTKILLASHAFSEREVNHILSKLVDGCVPLQDKNRADDLISNEEDHYMQSIN